MCCPDQANNISRLPPPLRAAGLGSRDENCNNWMKIAIITSPSRFSFLVLISFHSLLAPKLIDEASLFKRGLTAQKGPDVVIIILLNLGLHTVHA